MTTAWRTPSSTTKSLPTPCIFANFSFTPAILRRCRSVPPRLAGRARLEALVRPEVLLRHLAHALLDERIHAVRVGDCVLGREVFPGRVTAQLVASAPGKHARDARHHPRT